MGQIQHRFDTMPKRFTAEHQLFIADLHLQSSQAANLHLAHAFLTQAQGVGALYILGDLFEYWLGDDAQDPAMLPISDAINALSQSGTAVHLMHGNRDFLLGEHYAQQVGATLHRQDEIQISLAGQKLLLLHGDTLCTDDNDYQALRQLLRGEQWQKPFLALPIDQRIEQANALRDKSRKAVAEKRSDIMDVNNEAVSAAFKRSACEFMLHGHTHRPAEHALSVQGQARKRIVLGDWRGDHAQYAHFDGQALTLTRFQTS